MSIAPGTFEQIQQFGSFLIGKCSSALQRHLHMVEAHADMAAAEELFYNQAKSILRKQDKMGLVHPKLSNIACPPVYACGYTDQLDSVDENGCVDVPEGPGLGVVYDWKGIEKYRTGEAVIGS